MSNNGHPDYKGIDIPNPDEKPRTEWGWRARRAELLQMVLRRGGPTRLPSQASIGETYGVDQSTISRDLTKLAEQYEIDFGERMDLRVEAAFVKIYDELMDEGEYEKAWRVVEGYQKLGERRGHFEQPTDKHEITHREASGETEAYEIIPDDEAEAIKAEMADDEVDAATDGE